MQMTSNINKLQTLKLFKIPGRLYLNQLLKIVPSLSIRIRLSVSRIKAVAFLIKTAYISELIKKKKIGQDSFFWILNA